VSDVVFRSTYLVDRSVDPPILEAMVRVPVVGGSWPSLVEWRGSLYVMTDFQVGYTKRVPVNIDLCTFVEGG